jgi:LPXTG-motif cell wall-anchored protein
MSATVVFVLFGLVLLLSFVYLATRRRKNLADLDQALTTIHSLDIIAFRNLVDPDEEAFLRARLPAREFRRLKRERIWAALAYVKALSHASLQFARFGDAARRSQDPAIAASGRQIANSAIYLRLRALDASVQLTLAATFPGWTPRALPSLMNHYERATYLLENHTGLERARSLAA